MEELTLRVWIPLLSSAIVLTDAEIAGSLSMRDLIPLIEDILREKAQGHLLSPPRFELKAPNGALIVSAGGIVTEERGKNAAVIGIRAYGSFKGRWPDRDDVISVFDSERGFLKGVVIGNLLGDMRTGAIGGVAIKFLSRTDSKKLGVIGTGHQARTQIEAAATVRDFEIVRIYSRSSDNRKRFASTMRQKIGRDVIPVDTAEEAVKDADIVICATVSPNPVLKSDWIKERGVHINSIGPKYANAHELDLGIVSKSGLIATDSIAQTEAYPSPFFLNGTEYREKMVELHEIVSGRKNGRTSKDENTLFISTGLAGTEIIVASHVLEAASRDKKE